MRARLGYGEAAANFLHNAVIDVPYANSSVLVACLQTRVPVTIHLAIGTDIPHMHRTADGAALGSAPISTSASSAPWWNKCTPAALSKLGLCVLLRGLFLKSRLRSAQPWSSSSPHHHRQLRLYSHYRPLQNVVRRPTASVHSRKGEESRGYAITGHHELLLPLVAAALVSGWPRTSPRKKSKSKNSMTFFDDKPSDLPEQSPHFLLQPTPSAKIPISACRRPISYAAKRLPLPTLLGHLCRKDFAAFPGLTHFFIFIFFAVSSFFLIQTALDSALLTRRHRSMS